MERRPNEQVISGQLLSRSFSGLWILTHASPERIRAASTPFPGNWISAPPLADPLRVSSQMVDRAQVDEALSCLEQFVSLPAAKSNPERLADVQYVLAVLLESQQQQKQANGVLRNSRGHNPRSSLIPKTRLSRFSPALSFSRTTRLFVSHGRGLLRMSPQRGLTLPCCTYVDVLSVDDQRFQVYT